MKRDLDYRGGPLEMDGRTFEHGILLCPLGKTGLGIADFDLSRLPPVQGLTATVGIEDMVNKNGRVEFVVEGRIGKQWKELYRSPRLHGGDKPVDVHVDFPADMKQLRLKTTDGGNGASSDHALWAEAKFFQ